MQRNGRTMGMLATLGVVAAMVMVLPGARRDGGRRPRRRCRPFDRRERVDEPAVGVRRRKVGERLRAVGERDVPVARVLRLAGDLHRDEHERGHRGTRGPADDGGRPLRAVDGARALTGNLSIQGHESDTGFANLSATAQVYENGTARERGRDRQRLLARGASNLTESYSLTYLGKTASGHLDARGSSQSAVAFTPSLGLVPWNARPNGTWNSTAAYIASGAWSLAYQSAGTRPLRGRRQRLRHPERQRHGHRDGRPRRADLGTVTLANGRTVPVIAIGITGPFDDVDGFLLVPHGFEIFGAGHHVLGRPLLRRGSRSRPPVSTSSSTPRPTGSRSSPRRRA